MSGVGEGELVSPSYRTPSSGSGEGSALAPSSEYGSTTSTRADYLLREYDKLARQCATDAVDHVRYLLRLAELELIERERRMVERRIKEARFPAVKSRDSFDFLALPSLNKTLALELARSEYVLRRENVIAVGNSGTGKNDVALGLGPQLCRIVSS